MTPRLLRLTLTAALASALAATAVGGIYESGSPWPRWAVVAVAGVLAGVLATRQLLARRPDARPARLAAPLVALGGAGGLLLALTALAAGDRALLGVVPGPGALADLAALLVAGERDVAELAVPVPPTTGLLLLTALGVGLVALAVDTLAVSLRRPALAGAPLLALLVVPAGMSPGGAGWLPFTAAAGGWLALLLADGSGRARAWERVALAPGGPRAGSAVPGAAGAGSPDAGSPDADLDPSGHAGRRIAVAAVGLALVVPLLVPPSVQGRLSVGDGWGGLGGVGSASVDTYNPIVRLKGELTRPDPVTVLRVRTDDPDYLRLTALDLYDGGTWSQSPLTAPRSQRVSEGIPLPPGLPGGDTRQTTAEVEVVDLATRWLPVPFPPRVVEVRGDWRYDVPSRTVFSSRDETTGLPPYTVAASPPDLTAEDLDDRRARVDDSLEPFLDLPPLPGEVVLVAQQVTADAELPYDKAAALQEFFRTTGGFAYDTEVPEGNSGDDLLDFLQQRRGYCEQFAAAMAVMARSVGLPARVAIGYTAGSEVAPGVREVSSHDAHAWPEVYLPGAGWVRFEPTPRSDGASPPPPYSLAPEPVEPAAQPETPAGADAPAVPGAIFPGDIGFTGGSAPVAEEEPARGPLVSAVVLGLAALLAVPAAGHALRERRAWAAAGRRRRPSRQRGRGPRRRGRGGAAGVGSATGGTRSRAVPEPREDAAVLARRRAEVAWQQVRDQAIDLGLPWRGSEAPRTSAVRLARAGHLAGAQEEALRRLAAAVEVARFSARPPRDEGLRADARTVRAGLRRSAPRSARWRARVLPVSTLRATGRATGSAAADLLDTVDATGTRARAAAARRARRLVGH